MAWREATLTNHTFNSTTTITRDSDVCALLVYWSLVAQQIIISRAPSRQSASTCTLAPFANTTVVLRSFGCRWFLIESAFAPRLCKDLFHKGVTCPSFVGNGPQRVYRKAVCLYRPSDVLMNGLD